MSDQPEETTSRYWHCPWENLGPCGPGDLRAGPNGLNPLHYNCGWRPYDGPISDDEQEEE